MENDYSGFVICPLYICLFYLYFESLSLGLCLFLAIIGPINTRTLLDGWMWLMLAIIFGLCALMPLWDVLWGMGGYLDKRFTINADGVTYLTKKKRFNLRWEEIQHVVLYPDRLGRFKKHCFICFVATEGIPENLYDWHNFNEKAFGIQYRPQLVETIEQLGERKVELLERIA